MVFNTSSERKDLEIFGSRKYSAKYLMFPKNPEENQNLDHLELGIEQRKAFFFYRNTIPEETKGPLHFFSLATE